MDDVQDTWLELESSLLMKRPERRHLQNLRTPINIPWSLLRNSFLLSGPSLIQTRLKKLDRFRHDVVRVVTLFPSTSLIILDPIYRIWARFDPLSSYTAISTLMFESDHRRLWAEPDLYHGTPEEGRCL